MATSASARSRKVRAGRSRSQDGSAAAIDPTRGSKPGGAGPRVQPHHPMRSPAQPLHGRGRVTPGGSLSQPSEATTTIAPRGRVAVPRAEERRTLVAMRVPPNRSTTAAVAVSIATSGDRCASTGRQPGQRRREREDLGVERERRSPHQVEQRRRVGLHRLADVAQHDQPAPPEAWPGGHELDRLPAGAPGPGDGGPQRDAVPRGMAGVAAGAPGRPPVQARRRAQRPRRASSAGSS